MRIQSVEREIITMDNPLFLISGREGNSLCWTKYVLNSLRDLYKPLDTYNKIFFSIDLCVSAELKILWRDYREMLAFNISENKMTW